ncbi:MAG: MBL fold metallo-hydrolase [Gemmatimonadaceae bacterium]
MTDAEGGTRRRRHGLIAAAMIVGLLAAVAAYTLSRPQFGGTPRGDRLARMRANPQYRDGAFTNRIPVASSTMAEMWSMFTESLVGDEVRTPPGAIPVVVVRRDALSPVHASPRLRAFWIGHASVFIEIDGVRMLVDPVFSDVVSPVPIGPRRFHPPPIALADLPPIDGVLITHDHCDHLDMATVQTLARGGTTFFVPIGVGAPLERWGVPDAQVREMEWWQERYIRGVRIVSMPSRHYSGRGLANRNSTLWSAWSVMGARHRFYVIGDTGYSRQFREAGDRFGPFDLSFIKIGAYGPGAAWLGIHMSAEDAVRAHTELKARRMFPVHWGTFNLGLHDWDEPVKRAVVAARESGVDLLTPRVGEMVDADTACASTAWWEGVRN